MQHPQQPHALLHLLIVAALSGHTAAFANTTSPAGQTLPEVKVVEQTQAQENPAGPFEGYAASRSATATKTNTAIAETAQAISVIGRDQLEDQNANDLGQALRYTPGIQGEPFGVEPRFTFFRIRGFDASTTGLFRDGLKLSNPGFSISYGLEPFGAERIEVLRGPSSVLYGQASPGGLVNFVTRRPSQETHREFGIEVGSFDRKQATLDIGGTLESNDEFSYRLTGLLRNSDTQVDFVHDDRIYIAPAITWKPNSDTSLTLLTHYQKDDTISSQALPAAGTLLPNPNGPIPRNRFSGEPGVGKSTLLLEVASRAAKTGARVLYVSAEESVSQVRLRASRTGALTDNLYLAAETDLSTIIGQIDAVKPALLIVDSVQTVASSAIEGLAGGPSQVREVASVLIRVAKERNLPILLVRDNIQLKNSPQLAHILSCFFSQIYICNFFLVSIYISDLLLLKCYIQYTFISSFNFYLQLSRC